MSAHGVGLTAVSSSNEAIVDCSTHTLVQGKGMITLLHATIIMPRWAEPPFVAIEPSAT